jgi:hypothetical protein
MQGVEDHQRLTLLRLLGAVPPSTQLFLKEAMMKKTTLKKLTLSRETVLSLSEPSLRQAGAAEAPILETRPEDTYCPCTVAGTCM